MRNLLRWTPVVLALCTAVVIGRPVGIRAEAAADPHAYFKALIARADAWKSYSFRDPAQLEQYKLARNITSWVTYDPTRDLHQRRQDAAKIVVPDFDTAVFATLAQPLTAAATSIVLADSTAPLTTSMTHKRAIKIDDEIVVVVRASGEPIVNNTINVLRGQNGTTVGTHAAGQPVFRSHSSLPNQVRVPLGTSDGHTYLFTWDGFFTESFLYSRTGIGNYKTFTFSSVKGEKWLEINTRFDGETLTVPYDATTDIGAAGARTYNKIGGGPDWLATDGNHTGPNVLSTSMLRPQVGELNLKPNTWVRYWVLVDQRANDYDRVSMWVADETRDPVRIFDNIQLSVRPNSGFSVDEFWLEFGSSANELEPGRGPMTAYARNFVALRDVSNPTSLMVRPDPAAPIPTVPSAPRNLRIVR
jgi:hypothetical protein